MLKFVLPLVRFLPSQKRSASCCSAFPILFNLSRRQKSIMNSVSRTAGQLVLRRSDSIIKSPEDKRLYRGLELRNGMKVMLVSDPTTEKAAASLDLNIGHLNDPRELPGLAHFCEHMLFMGTEKFPTENEYQNFLTTHGGTSNAFTSTDHTNYHFEVASPHLMGALNRFAPFFICPLFTPDATEREVNAVDSENTNYMKEDHWRLSQLESSLARSDHDYSKFGTGSLKTLFEDPRSRGMDTRAELLKFHRQYYSANLMSLCVLGRESLDELEASITPLFGDVVDKQLERFSWSDQPYSSDILGSRIDVVPIKDLRSLHIYFPIHDLTAFYRSSPAQLPSHLLGHEGAGSLLSELKRRGWVSSICAGPRNLARGFGSFCVDLDLTEAGLQHVDDIVLLVFEGINLIRSCGVQEWIHRECEKLGSIEFRFKDKEKPSKLTTSLASDMHNYPIEEVLFAPYRMDEFRPDLVNKLLEKMVPENMLLFVLSKTFENRTARKEPWYGVDYSVQKLSSSFLQQCSAAKPSDCLKLPSENEFIPSKFDLRARDEQRTEPAMVISDDYIRLWYKKDDEFLLPKCVLQVMLRSPKLSSDPTEAVRAHMYVKMLKEALNEYTYNATLAGLKYAVMATQKTLQLSVSGFNEKMSVLIEKVIDKMLSIKFDMKTFEWAKERYVRQLRNFEMEQPYQHSAYYTSLLLSEQMWSKQELLQEATDITLEDLEKFKADLFSALHIEALVHGNATEEEAVRLVHLIRQVISRNRTLKPLLASQVPLYRELQLPVGRQVVFAAENKVHANSAIELLLQVGVEKTRENMLLELFVQIIQEPCFDQLRTKEQLGYIVFSGMRRAHGTQGLRVIVQSDRSPVYVENRIELFLEQMLAELEKMPIEEFEQHKASLEAKRLDKPKKLSAASAKYWAEIASEQYHFTRDVDEVAELKKITKEELLQFVKEFIALNARERRKLSVRIFSTEQKKHERAKRETLTDPSPVEKVKNISQFKAYLPLYPRAKPHIRVPPIGILSPCGIDTEE
uniref:Insulin-degrading enzyme n=1 Tax=Trichuris muris TaxID=70415 RepID=A0A5S6QRK5_TRIMR